MAKKLKNKEKVMTKKMAIGIFAIVAVLLTVFVLISRDPKEIQMVKTGRLNACSTRTVEQVVNGMFVSPKWKSEVPTGASGNIIYVKGRVMYAEMDVEAVLKFVVNGNIFEPYALEFNGVPQDELTMWELIALMCIK